MRISKIALTGSYWDLCDLNTN